MVDAGDTAWLLISSALVFLMTPALGFFYGGLVRKKNLANTIMMCFTAAALISLQWVFWGYTLAFGPTVNGLIGGLEWLGLRGVGPDPNTDYAPTVPHLAFMLFQGMFAVITPALIIGAVVERMKFSSSLLFLLLWSTIVYDPLAHWVWGVGGWLRNLGALDFAGGTVVHINAGIAALAAALVLKKRLGYGSGAFEPSNITYVVLGASLLWFGWFGFNAGSALTSGSLAASAFVATNTAASAATLSWLLMSWLSKGKASIIGAASGAVAGLVAVTPASGFVDVLGAAVIGLVAGVLCFYAVGLRSRLKIDDSLDVWGVHGVGGTWGAIATGIFANPAINPAAAGLLYGNPYQLVPQLLATAVAWVYSFTLTYVILKLIDKAVGLRVKREDELVGLDLTQHAEPAYV
ncbi:MAG: ammonium transporter [Candidatus Caldarchaeum sp.]|nr:ammonium transporter [Candidatus Caldarchaeum sp.]